MFLTEDPTDESHAISCEDNMGTLIDITIALEGVTSYFPTRKPSKHELENCPRIEFTYLTPEWDPHSTTFQEQEEALMDNKGKLHKWNNKRKSVDRYISMFDTVLASTLTNVKMTQHMTYPWPYMTRYKSQELFQVLIQRIEGLKWHLMT